jgi:hypothetical protein
VLAASLLPTTIAGHAFWTIDDPSERQGQRLQFMKNMAMLSGLLFAVIDSPKKTPIKYRTGVKANTTRTI